VNKFTSVAVFVSALLVAGAVAAQGVLVDGVAGKVIKKYETASCDQLKALKAEAPTEKEKIGLDLLMADPKARVALVDKIAAPVLNKMFDCGLIP
jgi:hypothetical protein